MTQRPKQDPLYLRQGIDLERFTSGIYREISAAWDPALLLLSPISPVSYRKNDGGRFGHRSTSPAAVAIIPSLLEDFEQACCAHSAAHAHRHNHVASAALFALNQRMASHTSA